MEPRPPTQPLQEITDLASQHRRQGFLDANEQRRLVRASQLLARDYVTIATALSVLQPAFAAVREQLRAIHHTIDRHRLLRDD